MIFNLEGGGGKATIAYTGDHTTKPLTTGGVTYTLYTLTGSGTLTVKGSQKNADVWICGGGANGTAGGAGGAGAYCAQMTKARLKGTYIVTVGASQGATTFGTTLSVAAIHTFRQAVHVVLTLFLINILF